MIRDRLYTEAVAERLKKQRIYLLLSRIMKNTALCICENKGAGPYSWLQGRRRRSGRSGERRTTFLAEYAIRRFTFFVVSAASVELTSDLRCNSIKSSKAPRFID